MVSIHFKILSIGKRAIAIVSLWVFLLAPSYGNGGDLIDSLLHELAKSKIDTNEVWVLRNLAYEFLQSDLDTAIYYSTRGYELAKALNFPSGKIWNLYQNALALEFKDQFHEAMEVYDKAYTIAEASHDTTSMAKLKNAIGAAFYFNSNYGYALEYYHQALALSEIAGYSEGSAHALNNLGVIYRHRRNFKKALDTYHRSLEIKMATNDTVGLVNAHYNLGLLYSYTNNYDESLNQFIKAEDYLGARASGRNLPAIAIGKGVALYNLEDYDNALIFLNQGIEGLGNDMVHERASALAYLGILEVRKGADTKGLEKLHQSYEMIRDSERLELKRQVAKELATAYELIGVPEQSAIYWKTFSILSDSINNEQKQWAFEAMQARYDAAEKDKRIRYQETALLREIGQNKKLFAGLIGSLILAIFLGFLWYKRKGANDGLDPGSPNDHFDFEIVNNQIPSPLTKREQDLIVLVEKGHTNQEIAEALFVSENTVKTHLKNIFVKIDAHNRTDMIHKLRNF